MDNIIVNRDYATATYYYDIAKNFIEQNVENPNFPEQVKNRFVECYDLLTVENAKTIYYELLKLHGEVANKIKREFNMSMFKTSGTVILIGLIPVILCQIAKQYIPRNRFYKYVDHIQYVAGWVSAFGVCMLFAVGH